jgi:hypothetical protein
LVGDIAFPDHVENSSVFRVSCFHSLNDRTVASDNGPRRSPRSFSAFRRRRRRPPPRR